MKFQFKQKSIAWLKSKINKTSDPTFLFIFTHPYSGSTALAMILNSADSSMLLTHHGEGQRLVPEMCTPNRWNPNKVINWRAVHEIWMNQVNMVQQQNDHIEFVIEESPPNLVRYNQLLNQFKNNKIIVFNRNPYANCASMLYRNHSPSTKSKEDRIEILERLVNKWIYRSIFSKKIIDEHPTINFTYEEFCKDTDHIIKKITDNIPKLSGISSDLKIKVKDYEPQKISDQNQRQISKLSNQEKAAIGSQLHQHEALLKQFGYTSHWQKTICEGGAC